MQMDKEQRYNIKTIVKFFILLQPVSILPRWQLAEQLCQNLSFPSTTLPDPSPVQRLAMAMKISFNTNSLVS